MPQPVEVTLAMMRESLYTAVVCDALDSLGLGHQSPRRALLPLTGVAKLVGRAKTTLWADMYHADPKPYELELRALDSCRLDEVLVAAAGGSLRSGIWGELLSTCALHRGAAGAVVDGAVRDVAPMTRMGFGVFAVGTSPYDSKDRQRVIDFDVSVAIDGVVIHPGDLVFADQDGVVAVPQEVEAEALRRAWVKVHDENRVRDAIRGGMGAVEAFERFGVL